MIKAPLSTLAVLTSALALAACATTAPAPASLSPTAETASPHERLFELFKASDEASLARNPLSALLRGDKRYADRFGDPIGDAHYAAERAAAESDLAALHAIGRDRLNATDQIAYDVFDYTRRDDLRGVQPDMLALTAVRPLNHFTGMHTGYATISSGSGGAPFETVEDYDNALKRHRQFAAFLDQAIARFRQGEASGVVETRLTVRNMIEQLDGQLAQKPENSPYFGPIKEFPDAVGADERKRLAAEYRTTIADVIDPALRRLRDFLKTEYLPYARPGVGLSSMKGGDRLYRYLVQSNTTLPLEPEQVHLLGLSEVTRITAEMDKVRSEVGFRGNLHAFFNYLRNNPRFKEKNREGLTQRYYAVGRAVDAQAPRFFSTIPKTRLEIRPYEAFREKFEAGGSYSEGSPDARRPGVFYFNAYDLPSRTTPGITTLYLHEGAPGHHFQVSLAQENQALPAFLRFGGNTAYVEGWALYAETLGYEMGLYNDPYQRFGTLSDEMLRAMRLVVDTGIHAKGWSRDQAIKYMLDHSNMGRTDVTAEVDRYIAIPGQALAYKIGALTIQRLRKKAEAELGPKFDIREFHAQVLMTGALPLAILERKIDAWIAEQKPAGAAERPGP